MLTAVQETKALKEWAVAVQALGAGRQIVMLRKGGIREPGKEFRVEHEELLLYPTYDHQRTDLLQPEHQAFLEALPPGSPAAPIEIRYWAKVVRAFEVADAGRIVALAPHYLWTPEYALERLHFKPKKPLHVLAVRVFELPQSHRFEVRPEYLGCRSWVELERPVPIGDLRPVLGDAEWRRELDAVTRVLEGTVSASSG